MQATHGFSEPRPSAGRRVLRWGVMALVVAAAAAFVFRARIEQVWNFAQLFSPDRIVYNFQNIDELFPARTVARGEQEWEFRRRPEPLLLPERFEFAGRIFDTEEYLDTTNTTSLLVVRDDEILFERYWRGYSAEGRHIVWSVSKSVVSALFGIAVAEGHVRDLMEPVTKYLPELAGSGYDGVPIKHVLQMSSGVGFDENYGDPRSDINRMGGVLAFGGRLLDFAATLEREREPGTLQHYVSIDTQVLGEILVRATGRSLSELTSEKLWKPLGMERDAFWMLDDGGTELAFGGLNASTRDLARFGRLYLRGGEWNGKQIVPRAWVEASITPDAPHLMPGPKPGTTNRLGYGYQWWLPADTRGDFMALGVYSQTVFVDPAHDLVIVRNAADRDFQRNDFEPTDESVALWRTIAASLPRE